MNPNNRDEMHPQDFRNLIIFGVLAIVLWFGYEALVLQPQADAIKEREKIVQEVKQRAVESGQNPAADLAQNLPREQVLTQSSRIAFKNSQIFGSINLTGGRIDDLGLSEYFMSLEKKDNVTILSPKGTAFPRAVDFGWVAAEQNVALPGSSTVWSVSGNTDLGPQSPVTLYWDNGQGIRFERQISMDDRYLISVTQRVQNNSGRDITLFPYGLVSQTGLPEHLEQAHILHEGPIGYIGEELQELSYKDLKKDKGATFSANAGWIGVTEKYWLTALLPAQGQNMKFRFNHVPNVLDETRGRYQVDYTGAPMVVPANAAAQITNHVFIGAKEVMQLEAYEEQLGLPHFDLAVDFGMLYFLTKPFFHILHFFGEHVGNFGIAIILLTILIRSAVFPLTNASYKSFAKMKMVAPQMTKLREKHGDDKQALQKDIMELYTREGVNPMAGCLPILLQIPIFFALYKVLFATIEMRHEPFFGWITDLSAPDPTSIFNLFGLIPFDVPAFLHIGVWPCVMLLVMLVQRQLNPPPQDKIQRDIMNIFPFVITYVLSRFASGLVIYWTFSALISVIQQIIIMKRLGVPIHLFGETEEEKKLEEAVNKGPAVHPLTEMAEDEIEHALFDHEEDEPKKPVSPPKKKKSKKKK